MKFFKNPLFLICVVLLIIIAYLIFWQNAAKNKNIAVYLSTGELYFGKLEDKLISYDLSNAWLLNKDDKGEYKLQEFQAAVWKPVGNLHISKDKIVFWTQIDSQSQVSQLIDGKIKSSDLK